MNDPDRLRRLLEKAKEIVEKWVEVQAALQNVVRELEDYGKEMERD